MTLNLPEKITATNHGGDIVLRGPGLTAALYSEITSAMPPEDRQNVIGWVRTWQ